MSESARRGRQAKATDADVLVKYFDHHCDVEATAAALGYAVTTMRTRISKLNARQDPRYAAAKAGAPPSTKKRKARKEAQVEAPADAEMAPEKERTKKKKKKKQRREEQTEEQTQTQTQPEPEPEREPEEEDAAEPTDAKVWEALEAVNGNAVKAATRLKLPVPLLTQRMRRLREAGHAGLLEMEERKRADSKKLAAAQAAEKAKVMAEKARKREAAAAAAAAAAPAEAKETGSANEAKESKTPKGKKSGAENTEDRVALFTKHLQTYTEALEVGAPAEKEAKAAAKELKRKRMSLPAPSSAPAKETAVASHAPAAPSRPATFKEMSTTLAAAAWKDARLCTTHPNLDDMFAEACRVLPPLAPDALLVELHGEGGGRGLAAMLTHIRANHFVAPEGRCFAFSEAQRSLAEMRNQPNHIETRVIEPGKVDGRQRSKLLGRDAMDVCLVTFALAAVPGSEWKAFLGKLGALVAKGGVIIFVDQDAMSVERLQGEGRMGMLDIAATMGKAGFGDVFCSWKAGELFVLRGVKMV